MIESFNQWGYGAMGGVVWPVVWALIRIVVTLLPLLGLVAYLTLWERKAIGWSQIRPGPNRVGPLGLLTPIADAAKLSLREIIGRPASNGGCLRIAPVLRIFPALPAWAWIRSDRASVLPTSTPACCS